MTKLKTKSKGTFKGTHRRSAKSEQPSKPRMSIVQVKVPTIYELVYWPDGCHEVPTYDQISDTLDIITEYTSAVDEGPEAVEDLPIGLEELAQDWLSKNSLERFKKALADCERHQELVDSTVVDNIVFPFPLREYRKDN